MRSFLTGILIFGLLAGCGGTADKMAADLQPYTLSKAMTLSSEKELGFSEKDGVFTFRVFAPRALAVTAAFFNSHDGNAFRTEAMTRDNDGVWELALSEDLWNKYYGYYVKGPKGKGEIFDENVLIADPYSKAVVTKNHYLHPGRSVILKNDYDWEGDSWISPADARDLIIYEAHLRDLTAHPSSGVDQPGTYPGLTQTGQKGGLEHLKSLGVNAVEFLPLHDFGNWEIPFQQPVGNVTNTWNPYARNHWGYMTSYFFAPESYYASGGTMEPGKYNGIRGQQVNEFRDLVKTLHRNGIAVIMDVVYNHVSHYDHNPLKYIDKKYYFRLDKNFEFLTVSGCGNDYNTEAPMARKLIVDSVIHWMKEYHIDGFRFDLAAMIDEETAAMIIKEAQKVNPNVVIIAEPWGGGYKPDRFSELGWASWNDRFRNGVKGQNSKDRHGFIFGEWDRGLDRKILPALMMGTLRSDSLTFLTSAHSVNYLESHDDNTFGDFIRLALGKNTDHEVITDLDRHAVLTGEELALNKLGAFILASSQGITMIHSGQEFARSKVIYGGDAPDPQKGMIDHNSYNKDDETNYINYEHRNLNHRLVKYYRELFNMRKGMPELRRADRKFCTPVYSENVEFALGYRILPHGDLRETYVLVNSSKDSTALFELGDGYYDIYANDVTAGAEPVIKGILGQVTLQPRSGMVLVKH